MAERHHASVRQVLAGDPDQSPDTYEAMGLELPGWREQLIWKAREIGPLKAVGVAALILVAGAAFVLGGSGGDSPLEDDLPLAAPLTGSSIVDVGAPASTLMPTSVLVHAAGAVMMPGIYELAAGARVADLVEAAGGPTPEADLDRVNLAGQLTDGSQVYLPTVGEPDPGPGLSGVDSGPGGGPVDVNTADASTLETLPGIGPATAAAIVQHRDQVGSFASVEELLDVPGIGEAKLAQLYDLVTVR